MRLTGGEHRGRTLVVPGEGTRPTQDKVRAAIFSALAAQVPGSRVLDLFAGTGAMGFEAWSRGAARVDWVENGRPALGALRKNFCALKIPETVGRIIAADVFRLLAAPCAGEGYGLVLADPPYSEAAEKRWAERLADMLARNGWVAPGGIFVFETEGRAKPPTLAGWRFARDKTYGAARVWMWVCENDSAHPA